MGNDKQKLIAIEVEQYLIAHPDFFVEHPDALDDLVLSDSPEGTISLAERQRQRLQEKNHQLSEQLHALIENAHDNMHLQQRVHQLCLHLLDSTDLSSLMTILVSELKNNFGADDVSVRLFYTAENKLTLPELEANIAQCHADDLELKIFDNLLSKQQPVCGRLTKAQKTFLFDAHEDEIQSVACLPLGHEPCAGLLAIGSQNPNRFHADMATDYLAFLGEVFMRILRQFCHAHHEH